MSHRFALSRSVRAAPSQAEYAAHVEQPGTREGGCMSEALLTYRGTVYPWHCDHIGHMNVMWYVGKFDEGTRQFFNAIGLTPSFLRTANRGMAAVDQQVSLLCPGSARRRRRHCPHEAARGQGEKHAVRSRDDKRPNRPGGGANNAQGGFYGHGSAEVLRVAGVGHNQGARNAERRRTRVRTEAVANNAFIEGTSEASQRRYLHPKLGARCERVILLPARQRAT